MNQEYSLPVKHVSDTAWLVAMYRASESEREDRHFNDHLAVRLVQPKKEELLKNFPDSRLGLWLMAVRTKVLDELILNCVQQGINTIVNLAAGLDTRPYRLDLPKDLRWIEVDLRGITEFKVQSLAKETPRCRLERLVVDLSEAQPRRAMLSQIAPAGSRVLVLTEGLLGYLRPQDVADLAADLALQPNIEYWLMDLMTKQFYKWSRDHHSSQIQESAGDVQFKFVADQGAQFFHEFGWDLIDFRSFATESVRLNRMPNGEAVQNPDSKEILKRIRDSGIALFHQRNNSMLQSD